jgi:hypothetical protein
MQQSVFSKLERSAFRIKSEQLFASKYRLVLPSEEELRREIDRERAALDERQALESRNL